MYVTDSLEGVGPSIAWICWTMKSNLIHLIVRPIIIESSKCFLFVLIHFEPLPVAFLLFIQSKRDNLSERNCRFERSKCFREKTTDTDPTRTRCLNIILIQLTSSCVWHLNMFWFGFIWLNISYRNATSGVEDRKKVAFLRTIAHWLFVGSFVQFRVIQLVCISCVLFSLSMEFVKREKQRAIETFNISNRNRGARIIIV